MMGLEHRAQDRQILAIEHHSFPLHAGHSPIDSKIHAQVRAALEDCAGKLQRKLHGQGIEASPAFEATLHHCKGAIDSSLKLLYPPPTAPVSDTHDHFKRNPISFLDSSQSSNQSPRMKQFVTDSDQCKWARPKSWFNNHQCSRNICDWANGCHFDRCYKRDKNYHGTDCHLMYLNDTGDDFLLNAPFECNLCLPNIDCEQIDQHCEVLESREHKILLGLLVGCGLAIAVCCIIIWIFGLIQKRNTDKVLHSLRTKGWLDGNSDKIETRTRVMPTAQNNMRIRHLGLVRHPAWDMGDEAFENPRPAPAPPIQG